MPNDINHVFLSGRIVADPQTVEIQTQDGPVHYLKFSVAHKPFSKDQSAQQANFFDCVLKRNTDYYADKLLKGTYIVIDGSLKQDRWTDKQTGQQRSKVVITIRTIVTYQNSSQGYQGDQQNQQYQQHSAGNQNYQRSSTIRTIPESEIGGDYLDETDSQFGGNFEGDKNEFYDT